MYLGSVVGTRLMITKEALILGTIRNEFLRLEEYINLDEVKRRFEQLAKGLC
ncbi:hypothetical protein HYD97_02390 [Mycoplasmopsis bovis]|nr:hypothetical protein [Mycoplasmopsis bovis]QQH34440.1 hypothetical protein HYD97_02390 [Mycoplasmopsis bovis]